MKHINFYQIAIAISVLIACSSDDNNTDTPSLEGRWDLTSESDDGIPLTMDYCALQTHMILSESGSGLYYWYYTDFPNDPQIEPCGLDAVINISSAYLTGNTYSMTQDWGDGDVISGTATINNNELTFSALYDGTIYEQTFTKN